MKPVLLKIKGLNSFVDEQTIEFDKLVEKGLFGIFGPTGSGKSTILDAITMALYGKISRDNKGYINSNSDRLEVSYRFSIGVGENRKEYICDRSVKVDKKGGYKTTLARICEINSEKVQVLAEGASNVRNFVEFLIGLSAEDFTRSVVLPQGKFSEFLTLTGMERRSMLERIFKLEKYGKGLREKIKKIKDEQEKLLIELNGKISRYNDISTEKVEGLSEQLKILEKKEVELKKEKEKSDKQYEEYKSLWEFKEELQDYTKQYNKLLEKQEEMSYQRIKLKFGKSAFNIKPFIDELKKTERDITDNDIKLNIKKEQLEEISKRLKEFQKDYHVSLEEQRIKIPELVKKSTELSRAIDISKRIREVEKQRQDLRIEYDGVSKNIKSLQCTFIDVSKERKKIIDDLERVEKDINEKTVKPEYRNALYSAYDKYCKCEDINKDVIVLKEKHDLLSSNIQKNLKCFEEIKEKKINLDKVINDLLQKKVIAQKQCPDDGEKLLSLQQEVTLLNDKKDKTLKNLEEKKCLYKKYEGLLNIQKEVEDKKNGIEIEYNKKFEKLKDLEKELDEKTNENIAAILAKNLTEGTPCPVCGSIHHIKKINSVDENFLESLKISKEKLQGECEILKKNLNLLSVKIAELTKDKTYLQEDLQRLNFETKEIDIKEMEQAIREKQNSFVSLKENINKWNELLSNLERELDNKRNEKLDVDKNFISLQEKISGEKSNLKGIKEELGKKEQESLKLIEQCKVSMRELKIKDIQEEVINIKSCDEKLVSLKKLEKEMRDRLNNLNSKREEIQQKSFKLESERAQIEQSGKEKKSFIDEYGEEVKKICKNENPEETMLKVKKEIEYINFTEKSLRDKLENINKEESDCQKEKISLEKNLETLQNILKSQISNVEVKLKEYGFKDKEEVLKYFISREEIDSLEKLLSYFDDEKIKLEDNIKRLENKMQQRDITKEQWQYTKDYKFKVQQDLNQCIELKGQKIKELKDMEKALEEVQKFLKIKQEYEHKYSLFMELDDLVRGNKFVEFVAMNELKYIAVEASKRLKDITRGRYALEIDEDGNFIMRDDFNGGTRRNTNTLSGGETFLTSLSLALALSSQIQLKGKAPLEFFFLDEGFGTLDNELLDLVMTSLEKLRSEKLSVGIISHVEELKNRVPVKLIVTPASQGVSGTLVNIEYS